MTSRQALVEIAADTERILLAGRFRGPDGDIDVSASLAAAVSGTVLHRPDDQLPAASTSHGQARIEVTGESTLQAARRLAREAADPVACLNFASALMPGGGWASGAQAQEESLARSSGLVACLRAAPEFYEFHRRQRDPLYSDHIVYSPAVPVFKDDSGAPLAEPYLVAFVTSPAPNAGELTPEKLALVPRVVDVRAARVLAVAAAHGHRRLVLGAWGCGVFRNDPRVVADAFARHLREGGEFAGRFELVVFAVLDSAPGAPTRAVFEQVLGG
jgi:uncharacterized protein (TIGR02452 family)